MASHLHPRTKVFISYSHKDIRWAERFHIHLKPLEREGIVERWDDTMLKPGSQWREEIKKAIDLTKVAVLFISADFLASEFIASNELPPLLTAADRDKAVIIPVIIGHSRFAQTPSLSRFQTLRDNPPSKPLGSMTKANQEKVFVRLTEAIEKALNPNPKYINSSVDSAPPNSKDTIASKTNLGPELSQQRAETSQQDISSGTTSDPTKLPYQGSAPSLTPSFEARAGTEWVHPIIGSVFVFVPSGRYIIGGGSGLDENPRHTVLLSGFWLGRYPVTNSEYWRVMRPTVSEGVTRHTSKFVDADANTPVVHVSWTDAMAFCERIGVTLPTEIQWEAAARGTKGRRYPWGREEPTSDRCNFGTSMGRPTDVHRYTSMGVGPFGTCDQCGNVWEWCLDTYREDAYRLSCLGYDAAAERTTPLGWYAEPLIVVRGGSWKDEAEMLPSTRRMGMFPGIGYDHVGFRVCIPPPNG